jgi:phosphate transport system substrate-binding protein
MKMNKMKFVSLLGISLLAASCGQQSGKKDKAEEGFAFGNITILADESFEPIVDAEERVFENLYPQAHLDIKYSSENQLLNRFLNDSCRIAIMGREPDSGERRILDSRKLPPIINRFAIDAVTLIVNQASADTLITVADVKKMLNGQTKTDKNIVFDNPNSSLVNYLKQLAGSKELKQKNIYALSTNKEVIKYVSEHTNAVGIVGFSWLTDPDEDYAAYVDKVKVMGVRDEGNRKFGGEYFKPSQSTLVLKQYPLSRAVYIVNSSGKIGLGTGFASFLASDRGQRIILKSGLMPDSLPRREINVKKE